MILPSVLPSQCILQQQALHFSNSICTIGSSNLASSLPNSVVHSPNRMGTSLSQQASPTHTSRFKSRAMSSSSDDSKAIKKLVSRWSRNQGWMVIMVFIYPTAYQNVAEVGFEPTASGLQVQCSVMNYPAL